MTTSTKYRPSTHDRLIQAEYDAARESDRICDAPIGPTTVADILRAERALDRAIRARCAYETRHNL